MKMIKKITLLILIVILNITIKPANSKEITITTIENFYENIIYNIINEDENIKTKSINKFKTNPHTFITNPNVYTETKQSDIIIYTGMIPNNSINNIINNNKKSIIIDVSKITDMKKENNPHIWYDPKVFPNFAKKITEIIININKINKKKYCENLEILLEKNKKLEQSIEEIKYKFKNTKITATEPVFEYMSKALSFNMIEEDMQYYNMKGGEITPQIIDQYKNMIENNDIKIIFYNIQVKNSITKKIIELAKANNIQIIHITENLPDNTNTTEWMQEILNKTKIILEYLETHNNNYNNN